MTPKSLGRVRGCCTFPFAPAARWLGAAPMPTAGCWRLAPMGAGWLWHGGSSWSWSVRPSAVTMSPRRNPRGHCPAPWHPAFQAPSTGSGASTEGTSDRMSQQQPQPHPRGPWDGVIPWALSPCGCVTSRDIVTLRDVIAVWGSSAPGTSSPCGDATLWGTVTPRDIITV